MRPKMASKSGILNSDTFALTLRGNTLLILFRNSSIVGDFSSVSTVLLLYIAIIVFLSIYLLDFVTLSGTEFWYCQFGDSGALFFVEVLDIIASGISFSSIVQYFSATDFR